MGKYPLSWAIHTIAICEQLCEGVYIYYVPNMLKYPVGCTLVIYAIVFSCIFYNIIILGYVFFDFPNRYYGDIVIYPIISLISHCFPISRSIVVTLQDRTPRLPKLRQQESTILQCGAPSQIGKRWDYNHKYHNNCQQL